MLRASGANRLSLSLIPASRYKNALEFYNLPANFSKNDVQKAYLKMARIYHPDLKTGDVQKFKLLVQYKNVLLAGDNSEETIFASAPKECTEQADTSNDSHDLDWKTEASFTFYLGVIFFSCLLNYWYRQPLENNLVDKKVTSKNRKRHKRKAKHRQQKE